MDTKEAKKLGLRNYNTQTNIRTDKFVKIYANNVGFGATNWDTCLIFGEIEGLDEKGEPVVEQKVKINMTREFMKALSNLLATNVKEYEDKFGEISFEKLFQITADIEAGNKAKRITTTKKKATPKKKG